jgi:hypothetical protein
MAIHKNVVYTLTWPFFWNEISNELDAFECISNYVINLDCGNNSADTLFGLMHHSPLKLHIRLIFENWERPYRS